MSFFAEHFKQNWRRFMKVFHIIAYSQESDWIPPPHPTTPHPTLLFDDNIGVLHGNTSPSPLTRRSLHTTSMSSCSHPTHPHHKETHAPAIQNRRYAHPHTTSPLSIICPPDQCVRGRIIHYFTPPPPPPPCILTPPRFSWHIPTYNHPSKFWSEGPSKYSPVSDNLSHPYTISALVSMPDMGTHNIFW